MGTNGAFNQCLSANFVLSQVTAFVETLTGGDNGNPAFNQLTDRCRDVSPVIPPRP